MVLDSEHTPFRLRIDLLDGCGVDEVPQGACPYSSKAEQSASPVGIPAQISKQLGHQRAILTSVLYRVGEQQDLIEFLGS
jgi:hypothetical protein